MDHNHIAQVLEEYRQGRIGLDHALDKLRHLPFEDLGYAKIDHHRVLRQGHPEIIFAEGKSALQLEGIIDALRQKGSNILATRLSADKYQALAERWPGMEYNPLAKVLIIRQNEVKPSRGVILVATAGTSDIGVAEEAALTAEILGNSVDRLYDVGVAGIHRLLAHQAKLEQANVIIAVAGMEGALPSIIAGLTDKPVLAVPTSVGYGASFQGLSALLSMLNSCSSGVAVFNIDNGFGAGYFASRLNRQIEASSEQKSRRE
ncbi:MAG TPA: nickel pincer cofactor biosynthesis protein LarB [Syntrophomonas sp.]|jgi:hypothetical protein|nr:nickel pincer cofactor biosynthesis protein LarB [Syntrophomonas sp.]